MWWVLKGNYFPILFCNPSAVSGTNPWRIKGWGGCRRIGCVPSLPDPSLLPFPTQITWGRQRIKSWQPYRKGWHMKRTQVGYSCCWIHGKWSTTVFLKKGDQMEEVILQQFQKNSCASLLCRKTKDAIANPECYQSSKISPAFGKEMWSDNPWPVSDMSSSFKHVVVSLFHWFSMNWRKQILKVQIPAGLNIDAHWHSGSKGDTTLGKYGSWKAAVYIYI